MTLLSRLALALSLTLAAAPALAQKAYVRNDLLADGQRLEERLKREAAEAAARAVEEARLKAEAERLAKEAPVEVRDNAVPKLKQATNAAMTPISIARLRLGRTGDWRASANCRERHDAKPGPATYVRHS